MQETIRLGPDRRGQLLVTAGDRVGYFGPEPGPPTAQTDRRIECAQGVIRPGWINAHTHIYSGLAPLGMPQPQTKPENFTQILEQVWWRLDRALDEDSLRAAARYYVAESLTAGTTMLIDHHESPNFIEGSLEILADACQELGMRALICYGATERNQGRDEARKGLGECRRFIESNRRPLVHGLVGLHASFTVSDETIREAGELCRELDCKLHVHMAEDGCDVRDAQARGYAGPLERLIELEALPPGSLMAHGVHLDRSQVERAARRGLWFLQNPRSNRGNEVGYPAALAASKLVALGTDGYPSNRLEEAEALNEEATRHGDDLDATDARLTGAYDLASNFFDGSFTPLTVGGWADAVVETANGISHLVTGGRLVIDNGALATGDLDRIRAAAASEAKRLWDRMRSVGDLKETV